MTHKILNEKEIQYLKALHYLTANIFKGGESDIQNNKIRVEFITDFFDNYFTPNILDIKEECYEYIDKYQLEKGLAVSYLSRRMNQIIDKLQFHYSSDKFSKDTELESAYKTILNLFGIYKWIKVGLEFDFIAFLFKCRGEQKNGIFSLTEARLLCEELSEIFDKKELLEQYDITIDNKFLQFSKRNVMDNLAEVRKNELFNHYESHCITENQYDYHQMELTFLTFIRGGNRIIYKKIIEEHALPENAQPLTIKDNNLSDIVRFADCFNIPLPIVSKIFDTKVGHNNRVPESVTPFYRALKQFNPNLYREKSII